MRIRTAAIAIFAAVVTASVSLTAPASADDTFTWMNDNSNLCMGVSGASMAWGARVIQYYCGDGSGSAYPDQYWYYGPSATVNGVTYYQLKNANSHLCLALADNGSVDNGTSLVQWQCNGASDQYWHFYPRHSQGPWEFHNLRSTKCVGLGGGSTAPDATVIEWGCDGSPNQAWW